MNAKNLTQQPSIHSALSLAYDLFKSRGVDAFEVYATDTRATEIEVKDAKVETLSKAQDLGLSFRVLDDSRPGFSYSTSLDDSSIRTAVANACDIARLMPKDRNHQLIEFDLQSYANPSPMDKKGLSTPIETKIELAKKLEATCRSTDPRIKGVRSAGLSESQTYVYMMDRHGTIIEDSGSSFTTSVWCMAEQNGDSQMGGDMHSSPFLHELEFDRVAKSSANRATQLLGATQPKTMKCRAVFRNDTAMQILGFLGSSFSAESISKGRSLLSDKIGTSIISPCLTITNDGTDQTHVSYARFDAEGLPCKRSELVVNGIFTNPLCDLYYAKKLGYKPTASSGRSIKSPPKSSTLKFYIQASPTKMSLDDLITETGSGILITSVMGVHSANPITGDFSVGASGILINNGILKEPVKGFAIAGNILGLLKGVTHVGSDLSFYGGTGSPSLAIESISVGGS